jgi:hypothetical protein
VILAVVIRVHGQARRALREALERKMQATLRGSVEAPVVVHVPAYVQQSAP